MSKRRKNQLSYPSAITVMAVLCAFVLVKFQSPHEKFFPKRQRKPIHRKLKTASLETPVLQKVDSESKEAVSMKIESLQKMEDQKRPSELSQANCFSSLEKLAVEPVMELKKSEPVKASTLTDRNPKKVARLKITKRRRIKKKPVAPVIPQWVEDEFEKPELNSQDAFDNPAPLDELAETGFKEGWVDDLSSFNSLLASVQLRSFENPEFPFEMERPLYVQESVFKKIPFTELNEKLAALKSFEKSTNLKIRAPQSRTAWAKTPTPKAAAELEVEVEKAPTLVATTKNATFSKVNTQLRETESETDQVGESQPENEVSPLSPSLAGVGQQVSEPGSTTHKEKLSTRSNGPQLVKKQNDHTQLVNSQSDSEEIGEDSYSDDSRTTGGKIYGEVIADESTLSWLKSRRAHVELYLNRVGSHDPQDTIFLLDYQFPNSGSSFEIDGTGIKGKYKLFAGIYVPESSVPIVQVPYSKILSAENYKEKVYLTLNKDALSSAPNRDEANRATESVSLTLTLFDGAPGNYRKPKTIQGGEVSILGYPELGLFHADKDGNVRIPSVPVSSELVIEAKAPGYFPGRQTVPVFTTAAYSPIYLVEKDKVDVVTRFFTKKVQQAEKSVVMGRVYDVNTRAPRAGETLSLSHRKGNAVYFGALPETQVNATLDTGLFGFYNVESSIRAIGRGENQHSLLINVEPGYGYFVELGRGGSRNILGHLFDPFVGQDVNGTVQLVGDALPPAETQDKGRFTLVDLDLPPGVVTLEAFAEGYPRTWFTIPWSTRESERERSLYMIERDLIKESANRIARVKHEKNTGVIVGGANQSLFKAGRSKVGITLLTTQGQLVSSEHGPFSLSQVPKSNSRYVLTPADPGFSFFNIPPGEYLLKMTDENGKTFRSHVIRVGVERVSVVVN